MFGGKNCEQRDFWNTYKFPKEIAKLIPEFDRHWGRIFKGGFFQNDNLLYIIENGPREFREKAFNQLLKQNSSNRNHNHNWITDVEFCLSGFSEFKEKAWLHYFDQYLNDDELHFFMKYSSNEQRERAKKFC